MIKIETVKTDTFSMDFFRFGHGGQTLVILPGLSVQSVMPSAEAIRQAYGIFEDGYTVYVFDRRKELPAEYSVYGMAEDTSRALDTLGLHKTNILGVSQGGMIAMALAINNPDAVEKLVLCSTCARVLPAQFNTIQKWVNNAKAKKTRELYLDFGRALYPADVFESSRELLTGAAKTVTDGDLNRFITLAEGTRDFDVEKDIEKIACPVLLIGSRDDRVLGAHAVLQTAKRFESRRSFNLYMYDGYGHAVYDTAPDFKERVLRFLREKRI